MVTIGRSHRAVIGHDASFAGTVARPFRRRIHPASGHSIREDERCFIGHYGRLQCSRSGRSSIENTVNLVCEILNRIRPLTLNMIGRPHQTPGFPDEKNFIHRGHRFPRSHAR
jgi:hypothetical protein